MLRIQLLKINKRRHSHKKAKKIFVKKLLAYTRDGVIVRNNILLAFG